jgi:glycosyltransferase involved in cell wall biosynthesis
VDDFAVDGESALIRPVGEPGQLADAILSLLADEDRRQQVVRGGLASASRFTWEAAGAGFHQALLATLGRPVST